MNAADTAYKNETRKYVLEYAARSRKLRVRLMRLQADAEEIGIDWSASKFEKEKAERWAERYDERGISLLASICMMLSNKIAQEDQNIWQTISQNS